MMLIHFIKLGRLSEPHEYRGAALLCLSDASSFMTGANVRRFPRVSLDPMTNSIVIQLVIDGGYTAW